MSLRKLNTFLFPIIFVPIYLLLWRSWKFEVDASDELYREFEYGRKPCIFSLWHSDDCSLLGFSAFRGIGVLVSRSRDGELITRVLKHLGYEVFRGSSSRGGVTGLLGLSQYLKNGNQVAIVVDGPRGPAQKVKPGVIELSRRTGMPIVPVRAIADSAWVIPSGWYESYIPKPFTTIRVRFNEAIYPTDRLTEIEYCPDEFKEHCQRIESSLAELRQ